MMHILSLGAGVQSTTMALMAAAGEIEPMPDCAIFADTQWEPRAVYQHLAWLEDRLPFHVHRVSRGDLRAAIRGRFSPVPFYTATGMGQRQCTYQYKLRPIRKKIRGLTRDRCVLWLGISTDEAARMKPSGRKYLEHRWPLIELRMSRGDCLEWVKRHDYPTPPKSSCLGCPFHSDADWRRVKETGEWRQTVEDDRAIRIDVTKKQYMHRSRLPLDQVDLSTAEERGQLNLFVNECEGLCGV
jgi:hypothetical protein